MDLRRSGVINQYNYAHGNPVMFIDFTGHFAQAATWGLGLGLSIPGVGWVTVASIAAVVGGVWLINKYGIS